MYDAVSRVRYYISSTNHEDNPVEFIIKQWPEVKYDGKDISIESEEPVLINTINGKLTIAIDPNNKLTATQKQAIPVILQKSHLLVNLMRPHEANSKPKEMSLGYRQFFSSEASLLDQASLKASLADMLEPFGIMILLIVIPVLTLIRLLMHIISCIFSMIILFGVLWWIKLNPTPQSVSRIVLFSSGAAEIISPVLLIFAPSLLVFSSFIEYWAVIIAVYGLASLRR
jgi:hypothetical protein